MKIGATLLVLVAGGTAFGQNSSAWSPAKAAAYLDGRTAWWMTWPKSARDHETFCTSCHTAAPIALSRPALHDVLGETAPPATERKLLDNITTRVRRWSEVEPFYADQTSGLPKTSESRGTESILNALILVWNDLPGGRLSPDARLALDNMWALQLKSGDMNGAWAWLQFHNAPWEGDSQFYGTALAAVAVGSAPVNYQAEPATQDGIKRMRAWLLKGMDAQTPLDRTVLLWASTRLTGLLTSDQQKVIAADVLSRQQADGGFTLSNLVGSWKRRDDTPLDSASDGYATGLIAFTLEQFRVPEVRPALKRALAWLNAHQAEDGRWPASSLNKNRDLASEAGLFMSDAATAYAVLALTHRPSE
jgi:squalene-hopene/tetraprenyl-beta-curcumene cyclase